MSVSDVVCTASAHLSCCTLGVLRLRVVVTVIESDGGGVVAVNIDTEGCCSHSLVSGEICMIVYVPGRWHQRRQHRIAIIAMDGEGLGWHFENFEVPAATTKGRRNWHPVPPSFFGAVVVVVDNG